jgi:hypothetical protein
MHNSGEEKMHDSGEKSLWVSCVEFKAFAIGLAIKIDFFVRGKGQDGPGQKSYSIICNIKVKICDRGKK